ncbi:hypothetical protein EIN_171320 [Entamoeba invadens IP1]|uniref:Uncharacterized protein n=1 Tax=Entamoeba invadens IP1 TaxID=370355 RepID=A0A0A1TVS0_ENTIV|nr:hypothetical protein EIN_171320 [Entamoeba invadens IP1]ELP84567.1 hypothetical protein EIN_171320 [Entamoeba invadens IP1]|eukprot:XP_004183913.1 hypothetical protein EIN_171320 [Entamoeba invadens IP1]
MESQEEGDKVQTDNDKEMESIQRIQQKIEQNDNDIKELVMAYNSLSSKLDTFANTIHSVVMTENQQKVIYEELKVVCEVFKEVLTYKEFCRSNVGKEYFQEITEQVAEDIKQELSSTYKSVSEEIEKTKDIVKALHNDIEIVDVGIQNKISTLFGKEKPTQQSEVVEQGQIEEFTDSTPQRGEQVKRANSANPHDDEITGVHLRTNSAKPNLNDGSKNSEMSDQAFKQNEVEDIRDKTTTEKGTDNDKKELEHSQSPSPPVYKNRNLVY